MKNYSLETVDYTLSIPDKPSHSTMVIVPGMACNRYGHPFAEDPKGLVEDIYNLAKDEANIIFPDIHQMTRSNSSGKPICGETVETQNERIMTILERLPDHMRSESLLLVGQSLGCLAVSSLAQKFSQKDNASAIFLDRRH
jgi:hypothetical protein